MNIKSIGKVLQAIGCQETVEFNSATKKHHHAYVVNLNNDEQLASFAAQLPLTVNRVFLKLIKKLIGELYQLAPAAFCVDLGINRFVEGQLISDAKIELLGLFQKCLKEKLVSPSKLLISDSHTITYFMEPVTIQEEHEEVELENLLLCSFADIETSFAGQQDSKPNSLE